MFNKGEAVYVTKVAWPKLLDVQQKCRALIVEHTTTKAVLLRDGDATQWFPLKLLKPSTNTGSVFLLPRWFKLEPEWETRVGVHPST